MLGKLGGSALAARTTGMSWRESWAIGTLMNTRGLMELVVLNIGLDIGVISPALFAMMVLMALATTFMTSPMLARIYPARLMRAPASTPPNRSRVGCRRAPGAPRSAALHDRDLAVVRRRPSVPQIAPMVESFEDRARPGAR